MRRPYAYQILVRMVHHDVHWVRLWDHSNPAVTKLIGREYSATGIWQRNYYEYIIRDEKDLQNKTDYIEANPSLWDEDENNPQYMQSN